METVDLEKLASELSDREPTTRERDLLSLALFNLANYMANESGNGHNASMVHIASGIVGKWK